MPTGPVQRSSTVHGSAAGKRLDTPLDRVLSLAQRPASPSAGEVAAVRAQLFDGGSKLDNEDWAWASWGVSHLDDLRSDPKLLSSFTNVHQLRSLVRKDHDSWFTGDRLHEQDTIMSRLAGLQTLREGSAGLRPGENVAGARADVRKQVAAQLDAGLTASLGDTPYRKEKGEAFARDFDTKMQGVFGDGGSVASAAGIDRSGGPDPSFRFHVYSNLHIYRDPDDKRVGDAPLFVPSGFSRTWVGDPTQGIQHFFYPKLGKLSNVDLTVAHVLNPDTKNPKPEKNDAGSVKIGSIGGVGGDEPGNRGRDYTHSHLEIFSADEKLRYAFVDAFPLDPVGALTTSARGAWAPR